MALSDDYQLELVQVFFRHGARTCCRSEADIALPGHIDKTLHDTYGYSQLTNIGKAQMYRFGCALRNRYNDFLGKKYRGDEVYAYTSDHERTKMSLQLVLAGLFPPESEQSWHPSLNWMPVPFHCVPRELDVLIKSSFMPKYSQLWKDVKNSQDYRNMFANIAELRTFFEEKGVRSLEDYEILACYGIFNVLYIHKTANAALPDWYTDELFEQLKDQTEKYFDLNSKTNELKKYFVGPLIKRFVENMNVSKTVTNPRKIYLYSGHESNIASFLRSHNIESFRYPNFGSAVILEKFRDSKNNLFVRMLFWAGDNFVPLKLGDHEGFCPINDYMKIVKDVIPTDEEINSIYNECARQDLKTVYTTDFVNRPKYKHSE